VARVGAVSFVRATGSILCVVIGTLSATSVARAQCVLPHTLTNGQPADATQVMANYNALLACLTPGGSTNAIQYNAGSGNLGGVGPLADGQLIIGSTGSAPQAQTLTAGVGIAITNAPGNVTIAGKRHNSGPLDPSQGGTGNPQKDFDALTGGQSGPAGDRYPPGTLIGPNGITLRPGTGGKGPRIDIPEKGPKPPETLHYP
jgi:hypothetical protein